MHIENLLLSEKEQIVLDSEDHSFLPQPVLKDIHGVFSEVVQLGNCNSFDNSERRNKKMKLLLVLLLSKTWQIQCEVLTGLCELCVLPYGQLLQDIMVRTPITSSLNGLQVVSSLLSSDSPRVQAAAARLIGSLCVGNENMRSMVGNFGLIAFLIKLLHSPHEDVQKHAAAAICCVVDDHVRNKGSFHQDGGLAALYGMINAHSSSSSPPPSSCDDTAVAAVSCIGALVTGYPPAQNAIRNLGMIPRFVSMLYTQPPRMVARVTCLLAEAARDNSLNAKAIVAEGGLQAVCHILSTSPSSSSSSLSSEAVFHGLKLLWCLCKDSPKRCRQIRSMPSNLVALLKDMSHSSSFSHQIRAAAALAVRTLERI